MTPVYLNPPPSPFPLVELKEDQHLQLFIPVTHEAASSVLRPIFFDTIDQDQRQSIHKQSHHVEKVEEHISHSGSSDGHIFASSSLLKPVLDDGNSGHKLSLCKSEDGDESRNDNGSVKWMSSKMRLMQRMMNSNCGLTEKPARVTQKFHDRQHENKEINFAKNGNNTIRFCSDCNTTTTPLWRSGPRGPKSLCNACGIRQRKARRAMAEAAAPANGMVIATETSSMKAKLHNKEKKSRTSHFGQIKKQCKAHDPPQSQKKLCFKDFALSLSKNSAFQRVFPQDEEEAAILLMELSCGLVHS